MDKTVVVYNIERQNNRIRINLFTWLIFYYVTNPNIFGQ